MNTLINYLFENKEWIFSGIGILALSTIGSILVKLFSKKKNTNKIELKQINKNSSHGTQIGMQTNNYYKEKTYERHINTNDSRK